MSTNRALPTLRRTVWICVIVTFLVGLPFAIWQADEEAMLIQGNSRLGVFFEVSTIVLLLFGVGGGICGCLIYTARTLLNGKDR